MIACAAPESDAVGHLAGIIDELEAAAKVFLLCGPWLKCISLRSEQRDSERQCLATQAPEVRAHERRMRDRHLRTLHPGQRRMADEFCAGAGLDGREAPGRR